MSLPFPHYTTGTSGMPGNGFVMQTQHGQYVFVPNNQGAARLFHVPHPTFYQGNPAILHPQQLTAVNNQNALEAASVNNTFAMLQQQQQPQVAQYYQTVPHAQPHSQAPQPHPHIYLRANPASQNTGPIGNVQLFPTLFELPQASAGTSGSAGGNAGSSGNGNAPQFNTEAAPPTFVPMTPYLFNTATLHGANAPAPNFNRQFITLNGIPGAAPPPSAPSVTSNLVNNGAASLLQGNHPQPVALFPGSPHMAFMSGLVNANTPGGPALLVQPALLQNVPNFAPQPPVAHPAGMRGSSPPGGQSSQSLSGPAATPPTEQVGPAVGPPSQPPPVPLFRPPQAQQHPPTTSHGRGSDAHPGDSPATGTGEHATPHAGEKRLRKSRAECINDQLILAVNSGSWDYRGTEAKEKLKGTETNRSPVSISGAYCAGLLRLDIVVQMHDLQPPVTVEELKTMYMHGAVSKSPAHVCTDFYYVKEGEECYLGYRNKLVLHLEVEGALLPLLMSGEGDTAVLENGDQQVSHRAQVAHLCEVLEKYMQHVMSTLRWSQDTVHFHIAWPDCLHPWLPSSQSGSVDTTTARSEGLSRTLLMQARTIAIHISGLTVAQIDEFASAISPSGALETTEIHPLGPGCACVKPLHRTLGFTRRGDFADKYMPLPNASLEATLAKTHLHEEDTPEPLATKSGVAETGVSSPSSLLSKPMPPNYSGSPLESSASKATGQQQPHTTSADTHHYATSNLTSPGSGGPPQPQPPPHSLNPGQQRPPRFQRQQYGNSGGGGGGGGAQQFNYPTSAAIRDGTEANNNNTGEATAASGGAGDPRNISTKGGPSPRHGQEDMGPHPRHRGSVPSEEGGSQDYRGNYPPYSGHRGRGGGGRGGGGHYYNNSNPYTGAESQYSSRGRGGGGGGYRGRSSRGGPGGGGYPPRGDYNGRSYHKFPYQSTLAPSGEQHSSPKHGGDTTSTMGGPPSSRRPGAASSTTVSTTSLTSPDFSEGNFPSLPASNGNGHAATTGPLRRKPSVPSAVEGSMASSGATIGTATFSAATTVVTSSHHRHSQSSPAVASAASGAKKGPSSDKGKKEENKV